MTNMDIIKPLRRLCKLDLLKTVYFNFSYFPFKTAIRLPALVYRHTVLQHTKGKIVINATPFMGMLNIGPHELGTQDMRYSRTIWDVAGTLVINGRATFGRGSRISIRQEGVLNVGQNFSLTGRSSIICDFNICFGNDCLLSWDILIMDTDFHPIIDESGKTINPPDSIEIGNHVWIGCKTTILKGARISNDVIIAACSLIVRKHNENRCIIGGQGAEAKTLRKNVTWDK